MHIGVLEYETLIHHIKVEGLLQLVNQKIAALDLGYMEAKEKITHPLLPLPHLMV